MSAILIYGVMGNIFCLGGYFYITRLGGTLKALHWANLIGCIFFVLYTAMSGVWLSTLADAVFGIIALDAILKKNSPP